MVAGTGSNQRPLLSEGIHKRRGAFSQGAGSVAGRKAHAHTFMEPLEFDEGKRAVP